jgi:uncharacterized protein (TIRG00374 family)
METVNILDKKKGPLMNRKTWRQLLFIALHSLGFVLLYLVIKDLEFDRLFNMIMNFPVWKVLLGLLILLAVYLIKTFRWLAINNILKVRTDYSRLLAFYIISGFLSAITPGRLGEWSKIGFMKKVYLVSVPLASSSVLLDRIWDVLILSLLAVSSIILMISRFEFLAWPVIVIATVLLFSLLIILFPAIIFKPVQYLVRRKEVNQEIESVLKLWNKNRFRFLLPGLVTSLAAYLLLALVPILFSNGLEAPVSLVTSVSAVSISNILGSIPVSIAGFGTRELVFTHIWGMNGYSPEIAISVSTVYFIITYLGSMLLGGIVYIVSFRKIFRFSEMKSPD